MDTTKTHIRVERTDAVGVITIDRRERFNSLDVETARDLRKAGLSMARDRAVRAVVLRGEGGVFCSGADLKYIRAGGDADDLGYLAPAAGKPRASPGEVFKQILEYLHSTISEIRRAPKPFIAAVDGAAAAGGLGLAICCDLVLASDRASFEWAYGKTALTGAESTTFLLPRLLGLRRALDLALLSPRLDAEAARALGLASLVFPAAGFDEAVMDHAQRLAAGPTASLATTKALFNAAVGMDGLDAHLDRELTELARAADGPDVAEGMDAFFAPETAALRGEVTVHEYSVVAALLDRVGSLARERRATAVHRLAVRVGALSGLDAELFATAFATFREGTLCAGAVLDVERVPARWACPGCQGTIEEGARLTCPMCELPARLERGDEIILDQIEMEVPDVQDLRLR